MTVTSDNILHNLEFHKKAELIDLLLKCPTVENKDTRHVLLGEMPSDITTGIQANDRAKVHVINIVNACMDHSDGFEHLMKVLRFFDGNTKQFKELEEFITKNGNTTAITESIRQEIETPPHDNENISKRGAAQKKNSHDINPFIMGQPVRYGRFFGREDILENLFDLWKNFPEMPIQNAAIWGERRIGKTSLLLHLKDIATANSTDTRLRSEQKTDWLPNPENYSWIFVDFQDARVCSRKRFLEDVLKNMKLEDIGGIALSLSNDNPLSEFSDIVSRHLKKPAIILLDEIDFALEQCPRELDNAFWEGLRALSTTMLESQCLGFVLASRRHPVELGELGKGNASPFFNIFGHVIELKEFTEKQARALIDSSPELFPEDDIQFMLKKSECKPHLLQILCRMCFDQLTKGKNGNGWRQKAEERINLMKSSRNQGKSSSSIGNGKNSK